MRNARAQYKALKTIQPLAEKSPDIAPGALRGSRRTSGLDGGGGT
jgi:hypothetical protein